MGMILFYCGAALLAATVITALVFRAKPLRYTPQEPAASGGEAKAPAESAAGRTVPMGAAVSAEHAGRTVPMDREAGMTVPMEQGAGATVPMERADATVPMDQN